MPLQEGVVGDTCGDVCSWPMRDGMVQNWNDMRLVWDSTWSKLGVDPTESR